MRARPLARSLRIERAPFKSVEMMASVERTRTLIRWIVASKLQGVTSQAALAAAIDYSAPELSGFMSGKNKKSRPFAVLELLRWQRL